MSHHHNKIVYLTIDDAPSQHLKKKIDFLAEQRIPALLFCRGSFLVEHLANAIDAITRGYELANHSYTHPKFSDISLEEAKQEIIATEELLERAYTIAGKRRPHKFFRFPYLDRGEKRGFLFVNALQTFLAEQGFDIPIIKELNYTYCKTRGYLGGRDVPFTFDACEYALFSDHCKQKYGLFTVEDFLKRMEKNDPENGFGLCYTGSSDIVLLHDFENTHHLFAPMVEKLQSWKPTGHPITFSTF